MIKCPGWLREKCPCGATCEAGAEFSEDSECRRMMMRLGGDTKPRTRLEQIRSMGVEELVGFLEGWRQFEGASEFGYCRNLPECSEMLDSDEGIPDAKCRECVRAWLMAVPEGAEA